MKTRWLILSVFLLAFALRVYRLAEIPPGLTHDEANHGVEAMEVLAGELRYYFPRNYGSEPLYSYLVALTMWGGGEHLLPLRLVNVWFGVLVIAAAYRLTLDLFTQDRRHLIPLFAAATLTLTFWPLAASREALRAGVLPFLTTMAVLLFWRMVRPENSPFTPHVSRITYHASRITPFALLIALMLHTYLAARVVWLVFPVFLVYLFLWHRPWFWRGWQPTVAGLLLAGLLVGPMFHYLQAHPYAQTRLDMLGSTLQRVREGNLWPLLRNSGQAAAAFILPGYGDQFLAYNIPGRPVFVGVMGLFFLLGIGVSLWQWRQPAYALILLWALIGILPSLITGPTANTTRNLAALTPLMVLPAIGLVWLMAWGEEKFRAERGERRGAMVVVGLAVVVLLFSGARTGQDYFIRWGEDPDVRAAYQVNLGQAVAWVNENGAAGHPIIFSTVYPGPAHDPSIAQVLLANKTRPTRWLDARLGFIFPGDAAATLIIPSSTPLHPTFAPYLLPQAKIDLRPDDLDPFFTRYTLADVSWPEFSTPINFNGAVELIRTTWSHNPARPGDVVELITWWQVVDPARVGPIVPPSFTTEVVFFTQILRPDNLILAQQDRLDVPSWGWQMGDIVVQIHQLHLPGDAAAGEYQVIVGIYDATSWQRTPVINSNGLIIDDKTFITPLIISSDH